mmetsp:Transcript_4966/g.6462  ORF Transcript_4966/g.6462 Transcript_4966/m.6462 type:complete len:460 (+) Transcript_4966:136-1515(+)|eukprot:CAMPEP_0198154630 /NCGR_PEP_ID=MMETSP1443-20131203/68696_1 /TAXON_ID=186043 /ORGANISM="Entomoneis sp., Strain CCMP2396" /LENGTH=459 /DNA_ID=CAMNT_0043821317 /DNA_START=39 /DNA_END=1418 /DNA_ORIENTATION=-
MDSCDIFEDLRAGPKILDDHALKEMKKQLREELQISMRETLQESMKQAMEAETKAKKSDFELHKLKVELASVREQVRQEAEQTKNDNKDADELRSMKAAFLQSMAKKAITRDVSLSLKEEMKNVFEEGYATERRKSGRRSLGSMKYDLEATERRKSSRRSLGSTYYDLDAMQQELVEKSRARDDIQAIMDQIELRLLSADMNNARELRNVKRTVDAIDLDTFDVNKKSKDWASVKQEIANIKAELEMSLETATFRRKKPNLRLDTLDVNNSSSSVTEDATLFTQSSLIDHPLIEVHTEASIDRIDDMEKKFDEVDKKGRFGRMLRKMATPKGLKKSSTGLYVSLQQNISKRTTPKRNTSKLQTNGDVVVLSPHFKPKANPQKLPPRYTTTNRALLKGNGCVLVCLSPTATPQVPVHQSELTVPTPESSYSSQEYTNEPQLAITSIVTRPLLTKVSDSDV